MKTKICAALALSASLLGASAASAEEGFYYGGSIGGSSFNSGRGNFVATEGNSLTLGVVAGYSFALQNGWSAGVEGSFDFLTGGAMSYSDGQPACTRRSPDWCDVDNITRVRGFVSIPMDDNFKFLAMGGFATASGFAEDGPTTFVDSRANGFTLGVGAQTETGLGTTRIELIYDQMSNVTPNVYDKTLKVISLKTSILF